ncbi:DEAD/DEAH box helicase [Pseudoalteromonas marina]|uniref:DEAD/DEAH box helicase n=1 Tax=Pseudoalteromonas marina TaxID=267375 RepID=UPI003C68E9EB
MTAAKSDATFTPNSGGEVTETYDYKIASWNSDVGIETLRYWRKKLPIKFFDNLPTNKQIKLLEIHGVYPCKWIQKQGQNEWFCSVRKLGILHISGDNVKLKRPYAKPYTDKNGKKKDPIKWITLVRGNDYTFGLDNLPKEKVKLILITSGESDTLAYNIAHNDMGYYAISFGTENPNLSSETIKYLRSRCEALVICYDGDEAGLKNAKKLSRKHNLPYLDLSEKGTDKVDICTLAQRGNFCVTMYHKTNEAFFTKHIERNESDPFSIGDIQAVRIPTKRYAGDNTNAHPINGLTPYQMYIKQLVKYARLSYVAKPGVGKSWLHMALSTDKKALERIGVKRVIFCVPTTAILEQLEKDFAQKEDFNNYIVINGETDKENTQDAYYYDVILTTHNSAHKILKLGLAKDALVVIDEAHELRNTKGYKDGTQRSDIKTCLNAFALVESAKKGVLVSATPLLELSKVKDYKLVICESEQNQRHLIQPIYYNKLFKSGLIGDADKRVNFSKGIHFVKFNNVNYLEAFRASLQAKYPDLRIEILSSKKSAYKSDNEVYNAIMNTGRLPLGIDNIVILTTSLLDTGVSFRFPIDSVVAINPNHHQSLIQLVHRPRMHQDENGNTINKAIKVFTYHPIEAKNNQAYDGDNVIDAIKKDCDYALHHCDRVNRRTQGNQDAKKKFFDLKNNCYYSNQLDKYLVDFTGILYDVYLDETGHYTHNAQAMYQRIAFENAFTTVLNGVDAYLENDEIVQENLKERKQIAKADKVASIEMLKGNEVKIEGANVTTNGLNAVATIVHHTTKDQQLKNKIGKLIDKGDCVNVITPKVFEEAQSEIIKGTDITDIEALERPMQRLTKLNSLGLPVDIAINLIHSDQSDRKFKILYNTIIAQSEYRRYIHGNETLYYERYRIKRYKAISKAMPSHTNRREFTKDKLVEFVKKAIGRKKVSFDFALSSVMELYDVKQQNVELDGKKVKVYQVGLSHLSSNSESDISKLFKKFGDRLMKGDSKKDKYFDATKKHNSKSKSGTFDALELELINEFYTSEKPQIVSQGGGDKKNTSKQT